MAGRIVAGRLAKEITVEPSSLRVTDTPHEHAALSSTGTSAHAAMRDIGERATACSVSGRS